MSLRCKDTLNLSQCLMVTSKYVYSSSIKYSPSAHDYNQVAMSCPQLSEHHNKKIKTEVISKSILGNSKLGNVSSLKPIADNRTYHVPRIERKESSSCDVVEGLRQRPKTTSVGQRDQLKHRVNKRPSTVSGVYRPTPGRETLTEPVKMVDVQNDGITESSVLMKYRSVISLLSKSLRQDNIQAFVSTLRLMEASRRSLVIDVQLENHNNLFFTACQMSRLSFIEYMLSECCPNLELPGLYDDLISPQYATPLWLAASSGYLPLTQLLIRHRAKVNAISSSGSTAVMAACCSGQLDIVFLLVTNGADVHFKTDQGMTCLMAAIQSPDIIKLLVRCGVRVNDVDCHGNTALHYAAEVGHLQTVQLLVQLGANPFIYNQTKCNVFLTAAKAGQEEIVEYLVAARAPKTSELINTFVILGAMTMVLNDNFESGIRLWQKAVTLHKFLPTSVCPFKVKKSILKECWDLNHLFDTGNEPVHITKDRKVLGLQALTICEKLYGPNESSFINVLVYRGAVCADNQSFLEALRLWKIAYTLNMENLVEHNNSNSLELVHSNVIKNVHYIVQVLLQLLTLHVSDNMNNSADCIPEGLTRSILELLIHHVEISVQRFSSEHVSFLMSCCLCVLFVYLHMYPPTQRNVHVGLHLRRLIQLSLRDDRNESLLHNCLNMHVLDYIDNGQLIKQYWPSTEMVDILILLGADPHGKDALGDSILHKAVSLYNQGVIHSSNLITTLLKRGVHCDQVNKLGQCALDSLQCDHDFKLLLNISNLSLKCLAARAVAKFKLSYIGEIPRDLYDFVKLHTSE